MAVMMFREFYTTVVPNEIGPWVFGLKNGNYCRYFYVHRRDRETLLSIIERECEAGSEIHSDEWQMGCI